jgi:predicted SnoaL-like aldol condensation-catalyzing enzyme
MSQASASSRSSAETAAQVYFDAVHAGSTEDLAKAFAQDAEIHFPMREPVVGRANIVAFYADVFKFYVKRHDHITRWFYSADGTVAAQIHFDGTTNTGRDVVFDAIDVFTAKDGLIQHLWIVYDSAKVLQMLGALPGQS